MELVSSFHHPDLNWFNDPRSWKVIDESGELEGSGGKYEISIDGSTLTLFPPSQKDFWSRTFYSPLLIKHDASGLLYSIPVDIESTIKVDFEYTPKTQFDQAGVLLYMDDEHWMKCGIEFCDNIPRLSVVVCNIFSDWSTQPWSSLSARLKIHKVNQSNSFVIEAAPAQSEDFQFVRIAHLSARSSHETDDSLEAEKMKGSEREKAWNIGPFAACPIAQKGCCAKFTNFSVGRREASLHNPDPKAH